ncbi:MAG: proteasome assembly chaperone family protein [Halobacteriaceae archaeon]
MDSVDIEYVERPDLDSPVLVEGLPGVGHVGKLAAEHLVEEGDAELCCRVYSEHFPPQVTVDEAGRSELANAAFHAVTVDGVDLLVLTGDHQAGDGVGHYRVTDGFLDVADEFGVETVYALGGVPTGELVDEYDVLGAATTDALVETLTDAGVTFSPEEPEGGIVGTSGLLLGLGERRGLPAACLMGETSGYLVDPKSAQAVLEVLQTVLGFEVDFATLEERAEEMEEVVSKLQEMDESQAGSVPSDEDLRYIG